MVRPVREPGRAVTSAATSESAITALQFAGMGVNVLPVWGVIEPGRCECRSGSACERPGKHPRLRRAASNDPAWVADYAAKAPRSNWAAVPASNGFAVLDVDPRSGGDESLALLESRHGALPETWRTVTGGGGEHIWLRKGSLSNADRLVGAGLDWKSGGYVLLPGSVHSTGRRYEWQSGAAPAETDCADAPEWLMAQLKDRIGSGTLEIPAELEPFSPYKCAPIDRTRLEKLLEPGETIFAIWHLQGNYSKYIGRGFSELDLALFWELQRHGYSLWDAQPVLLEYRRLHGATENKAWRRDYLLRTWICVLKARDGQKSQPASPMLNFERQQLIVQIGIAIPALRKRGISEGMISALQAMAAFLQDDSTCFMSVRKLGELMSRTPDWGMRTLRSLRKTGLITPIGKPSRGIAQVWQIHQERIQ